MLVKPLKKADFQGQTVHLPMVKLVGGFNNLEKYYIVSWDDYPIYEMETKIHVPNHQPGYTYIYPQLICFSIAAIAAEFPGSQALPSVQTPCQDRIQICTVRSGAKSTFLRAIFMGKDLLVLSREWGNDP